MPPVSVNYCIFCYTNSKSIVSIINLTRTVPKGTKGSKWVKCVSSPKRYVICNAIVFVIISELFSHNPCPVISSILSFCNRIAHKASHEVLHGLTEV